MRFVAINLSDNIQASKRGCYNAARAAALSGVPQRTLYNWARAGVVVPSVSPIRERLWSYQDLLTLRAIHWLRRRKGIQPASPMSQVRAALEQTVQQGLDLWNDNTIRLRVDLAGRIFIDQADGSHTDLDGQAAWDMGDSVNILDAIGSSPGLVRPTPHVRIAPARLAGEPFLLNSRVGTQVLHSLASDGYDTEAISRLYGIETSHVQEALDYEFALAA